MNYIVVNDLIKDDENFFRVLWVDQENTHCYVIDVMRTKALPELMYVKDLEMRLNQNDLVIVPDTLGSKASYSNPSTRDIEIRDNAWNLIKSLVINEPDIYDKSKRGKLIKEVVIRESTSFKTLIKYLRKYWQRGLFKNTLLPDYNNCGKSSNNYVIKTGRPRTKSQGTGININDSLQKKFMNAINRYYLSNKKPTLTFAYKQMLKDNFAESIHFDEHGKKTIIKPEGVIPTYAQFYYWFKKKYSTESLVKKREGKSSFERNYRQLLGSTETNSLGPGSLYQIDATPADVFLVNRLNPNWLIGKPTVYFVTDVFSRLITGFFVSLNNPSWIAMATALSNAFSDKVEFCQAYGISIDESDWPSKYLPEAIIGDRGELESKFVDSLINGLGVEINNNPPYRPDWKGIVEQLFHTSQRGLGPLLPGYLPKNYKERDGIDFRQTAKLTLDDYIKVITHFVLTYNKNHYMSDYNRDKDMIADNVNPTPIELWKWGIKNRSGSLRSFSKEVFNFYLLPTSKATVTSKGIRFNKKLLYTCEKALKENWFSKARQKTWKVMVSYDPRNMNQIYMHEVGDSPFTTLNIIDYQEEKFKDTSISEVNQLFEFEEDMKSGYKHAQLQNDINLYETVETIVEKAVKVTNSSIDNGISKSRKIKETKKMRGIEAKERKLEESLVLNSTVVREENERRNPKHKEVNSSTTQRTFSIRELFENNKGDKE